MLQIAAHERTFGLENLYKLCEIAYRLVQPYHIARVIARPFVGEKAGEFTRTGNRHDYAVPAPEKTLLDEVYEKAGGVYAVGKIADIFAHRGITRAWHATGLDAVRRHPGGPGRCRRPDLVFTNFVDFDSTTATGGTPKATGKGL